MVFPDVLPLAMVIVTVWVIGAMLGLALWGTTRPASPLKPVHAIVGFSISALVS